MRLKRYASLITLVNLVFFGHIGPFTVFPALAQVGAPQYARHGMVSSENALASEVGVQIMQRGGNAVDAAVAVALALAVTFPSAGNIGGGGFMVIRTANAKAVTIDYREAAPAKAHRDMYLDKERNLIPEASTVGYRAAGVPGTIMALSLALERYGTMKWEDVLEPARKLAADGFPVSFGLARSLRRAEPLLKRFPESKRIFLKGGTFYEAGEIFKQPELAATLRRLQENGAREFYEGHTAHLIAEDVKANGGLVTLEDLKNYKPVVRDPLRGTYRGYEIITMPPPSSGGVALLEMLNILEHYDLAAMGFNSSEKYHVMIEAMRRAYADRAEFLGDPDFVRVPVAGLTSKRYAAEISKSVDANRATPSTQLGHRNPAPYESPETTHFSVVDPAGNVVSNTYTLRNSYGSGATVRGAGFLLNNTMDDFAAKPGFPNATGSITNEANAIAPHKRPLSSQTPTIVLRDGKLFFAVGSPGAQTIPNTVLQVILNIIDHGMNMQQAITAPRLHHQWMPDVVDWEPYGLARDTMNALKARGHTFAEINKPLGQVQGVMIEKETELRLGASDPRNPNGRAVGY
jgi:gamma-glutamyltranspeptidase/glutathione hydrolase